MGEELQVLLLSWATRLRLQIEVSLWESSQSGYQAPLLSSVDVDVWACLCRREGQSEGARVHLRSDYRVLDVVRALTICPE